jgi:hypothetical protein
VAELTNKNLILKCIAIYMGNYSAETQYAASLLLKMLLPKKDFKKLMFIMREELGFKINDRNDAKVVYWKKQIKKIGKCEICGAKENLEAHHIVPWEYSVCGRTNLTNGQCLCEKCHKIMHNDNKWVVYIRNKQNGKK